MIGEATPDGCDKLGRICNLKNLHRECRRGGDSKAECSTDNKCICKDNKGLKC